VRLAWALVLAFAASAWAGEIAVVELPPEARQTLALIRAGGPFPYARDGAPFHNREGRLPERAGGYYREYTVQTPGARDRGARRIVAGRGGESYYTQDHYRTFRRIRE
jgi:ribonuclease T1